jgi:hypothetical protein
MLALYHNDMSLCAQKVRVCLAEKGLAWEDRHLVLRDGVHQQFGVPLGQQPGRLTQPGGPGRVAARRSRYTSRRTRGTSFGNGGLRGLCRRAGRAGRGSLTTPGAYPPAPATRCSVAGSSIRYRLSTHSIPSSRASRSTARSRYAENSTIGCAGRCSRMLAAT